MKGVNSWRPSNWEHDKFHECMSITGGGGEYADIYEVFEAGADAMLKAVEHGAIEIAQEGDKLVIPVKEMKRFHFFIIPEREDEKKSD